MAELTEVLGSADFFFVCKFSSSELESSSSLAFESSDMKPEHDVRSIISFANLFPLPVNPGSPSPCVLCNISDRSFFFDGSVSLDVNLARMSSIFFLRSFFSLLRW